MCELPVLVPYWVNRFVCCKVVSLVWYLGGFDKGIGDTMFEAVTVLEMAGMMPLPGCELQTSHQHIRSNKNFRICNCPVGGGKQTASFSVVSGVF